MPSARANLAARLLDDPITRGWAERVAVREPHRAWTYAMLRDKAARFATVLRRHGVVAGERVALLMPDDLEATAALLGVAYAGAVATPLSELARSHDVRVYLQDAEAAVAVVHGSLALALQPVRGEIPSLREVITVGGAADEHDFATLVDEAEPLAEPAAVEEDDLALLLYSAGAAGGQPRGVPHTHATPLVACESYARGVLALSEKDRVFSVVRLSTAYGLGAGLIFPLACGAETMLLPDQPHSRDVLAAVAAFDPTVMFATPSLYGQLARDVESAHAQPPLGSLRACVSGAEGMPPKLFARVRALLGAEVLVGYGLTEAFQFALASRPGETRAGSSGRPVPGCSVRILGDDGAPVGTDEIGTLELSGAMLSRGYWRGSDGHPVRWEGDWLRTRDRFLVDAEGWYFHCGRVDDLFKVGGKWVAPTEVEQALLAHEAVWECAVVGAEDEDGLVKPLAFVVPNIGHDPGIELARELRDHVKLELAPYKYPRWIEFLEELPRGPTGKVLRYKLKMTRRRRAETGGT